MNSQEYEVLLKESCEHLEQGRFRMALKTAKIAFEENPEDNRTVCCYVKALLENGDPESAIDLVDNAVNNSEQDLEVRYCRAYLLYRAGIYDSALTDINFILLLQKSGFNNYLLHSRILAALDRFREAGESVESACKIQPTEEAAYLKSLIDLCAGFNQKIFTKSLSNKNILIKAATEAKQKKEFWFALWASKEILKDRKYSSFHSIARLLQLEALLHTFKYQEAFNIAEKVKDEFQDNAIFSLLFRRILKNYPEGEQKIKQMSGGYTEYFENNYFIVNSIQCFDYLKSINRNKREYLIQFNGKEIRYIGVEVKVTNPFYNNRDIDVEGTAVWYLNDVETGRHKFSLKLKKEWEIIEFIQSWGTDEPVFWKKGTGKILIMLDNNPLCARYFDIKDFEIPDQQETEQIAAGPQYGPEEITEPDSVDKSNEETVENLLNELNSFTGLTSVKQSLWDFVTYLRFLNERKKHGLKTTEDFSVHCVFTGNPGTGKTTIARKLGGIFKAMGILRSGHVVEVDRASLVGQYVGETAQKTEKVINEASGGILFIDEAYTLTKSGVNQDFGQEAIDIILKRMEDRKDDFVVIAAGYPGKMQELINSNPGLKSRFTHFFHFDDYTPDELISIFKYFAKEEDYVITEDSLDLLKKEFIRLYRKRDESFGNARIPAKYLSSIKVCVSRRLSESSSDLSREAFTLIVKDDIEKAFAEEGKKKFIFEIDEEKLETALQKLNNLTGLNSVKKEINEIIKLTRYYIENGEDPHKNISGHLVFLGNPGTGKTSIARLFSEIYSALGILPKGHLVEVDRQALVGQYVGQTAIKTKAVIDSAIGGTLFIDEVYSLSKKDESDFGRESIDTLIKRMEDDKGKFILIAAGYTDETTNFLGANPGLSSRFYKSIKFEDYTPEELFVIAEKFFDDKKLTLSEASEKLLIKFFNEAYVNRDKKFGNARFVRNITDKIIRNHLLFIAGLNRSKRKDENTAIISLSVIKEVLNENEKVGSDSDPEQLLKELNGLVGLDEVKKTAAKLVSSLKVAGLREKRGFKSIPRNLHSVFYGNNGTGKFTTAKMLANIFKEMGILSSGHIVTANQINISSAYFGQSKVKTSELIQRADGGILYIDNAEFLKSENSNSNEIIEALLEGFNRSEIFICIIAVNSKDLYDEIKVHPLLSRYFINNFFFEDFNPRQMLEIIYTLADKNNYIFDEGALQLLMDLFTDLYNQKKTTDNAKVVKEIFYKAVSYQEERLFNELTPTDEALNTITFDDIKIIASDYSSMV